MILGGFICLTPRILFSISFYLTKAELSYVLKNRVTI